MLFAFVSQAISSACRPALEAILRVARADRPVVRWLELYSRTFFIASEALSIGDLTFR